MVKEDMSEYSIVDYTVIGGKKKKKKKKKRRRGDKSVLGSSINQDLQPIAESEDVSIATGSTKALTFKSQLETIPQLDPN